MARSEKFDYEDAEMDILDAGGDPDYLDYRHPDKADAYLRGVGLDPKSYGSTYDSSKKNDSSSDSLCYLTSACIHAAHLPDDCVELVTLRAFRDNYLKAQPTGPKDIEEYYEIAPKIVAAIDLHENSEGIWARIYNELVLPCVRLIKSEKLHETYELYKCYTLELKAEFLK